MANNETAFDPRVFDPHVFQIFGGQPVGPPLSRRPEFYTVVRKRRRPMPLQSPVWDKPPPPEPVIPLPPAWMLERPPEPQLPVTFMPPMPQVNAQERQVSAQMGDAEDTQDVIEALAMITEMLPMIISEAMAVAGG